MADATDWERLSLAVDLLPCPECHSRPGERCTDGRDREMEILDAPHEERAEPLDRLRTWIRGEEDG